VTKSSEPEQARRVNATVSLLKQEASPSEVLSWLIAHYGLSRRQAYRYLQQAQNAHGPLMVPEAKQVFTVKLSISLIRQLRRQARREGGTISQWVESALRRSLKLRQGHG
jgi:macrodomain Ter protein organizer (MatP/YcbG family)